MSGKVFEPTKRGAKQLTDYIKRNGKDTTVYTIMTCKDWGLGSERLYNEHTFDNRQPITGIWQAGHLSPAGLLAGFGTVYTEPPRKMRRLGDPAPQVRFPLGEDYHGVLDEAELRGLEKQVCDGSNPRTRRPIGGWRV